MLGNASIFARGPVRGALRVPGDKSISHRALIAAARCARPLRIANLNPGRDVGATAAALAALGAQIELNGSTAIVRGGRLREPLGTLDCMNSGSTARMMLGVCAGANLTAHLDGDASLRRRPMEPVAAQLRAFGAKIETTGGRLPLAIAERAAAETRNFILLAPSAQVKSALLFAGLFAGTAVSVDGDRGSRDHTERLLRYLGADIEWDGRRVTLGPAPDFAPVPEVIDVAGDFSSAAFFITAATIAPGSAVLVRGAGINPTRIGLLDVLSDMGARIELRDPRTISGEPVADIAAEYAPLHAVSVDAARALRAIDEIPLLAVAAACAQGTTRIAGTGDLRTKESDRIAAIQGLLEAVGVAVEADRTSLTIYGGPPREAERIVQTHGDHRIAMAAAVLACAAGPIEIDSAESMDVSFPGFAAALESLRS